MCTRTIAHVCHSLYHRTIPINNSLGIGGAENVSLGSYYLIKLFIAWPRTATASMATKNSESLCDLQKPIEHMSRMPSKYLHD
jgi:hypothetical protein